MKYELKCKKSDTKALGIECEHQPFFKFVCKVIIVWCIHYVIHSFIIRTYGLILDTICKGIHQSETFFIWMLGAFDTFMKSKEIETKNIMDSNQTSCENT